MGVYSVLHIERENIIKNSGLRLAEYMAGIKKLSQGELFAVWLEPPDQASDQERRAMAKITPKPIIMLPLMRFTQRRPRAFCITPDSLVPT